MLESFVSFEFNTTIDGESGIGSFWVRDGALDQHDQDVQ